METFPTGKGLCTLDSATGWDAQGSELSSISVTRSGLVAKDNIDYPYSFFMHLRMMRGLSFRWYSSTKNSSVRSDERIPDTSATATRPSPSCTAPSGCPENDVNPCFWNHRTGPCMLMRLPALPNWNRSRTGYAAAAMIFPSSTWNMKLTWLSIWKWSPSTTPQIGMANGTYSSLPSLPDGVIGTRHCQFFSSFTICTMSLKALSSAISRPQ
mmetsp:Transcript_17828/g.57748  ORF Transcript_17828/g.57748 Transcript_17828/m.57748 type:complete len:212 (-) Transcript_17828:262-897(-)